MDDLISRQAAIDALGKDPGFKVRLFGKSYDEGRSDQWFRDVYKLTTLPPEQPERMRGKWIPHSEKCREYIGTVLVNVEYDYWLCDACGYRVEKGQPMYNFCPNCGADMRGEADE